MRVIIIGGVAGGASAAARLRRLDENIEIIMFERGEYISYANCGLPYYIGGEITTKESLTLQHPDSFKKRFNVDVRINSEVTGINKDLKIINVKNLMTGEEYSEHYDKLIISTGAEPIRPKLEGMDSDKVFTLRNIPDTFRIKDFINDRKPKTAAVVGGGYIGVEMAENLKKAGLDVTIIEMADQVIAPLDYEMACDVHKHIRKNGVKLLLKNAVRSIKDNGDSLEIVLAEGTIFTDMLIMAVGVKPDTSLARNAGIDVDDNGCIIVSDNMLSSDPNIYAVGDATRVKDFVTGLGAYIPLAGPANKQGRIAADNICGINSIYEGTQGSAILKVFDMTIAVTGINEKTARKLGINFDKSYTYSSSHAGYYPGAVNMSIKIIFDKDNGKILGGQIVGYDGVDKRCDVLAAAIRFGAAAYDLAKLELCYAPPFSSAKDPINMAGFVIENILSGKVKSFHWHDVNNIIQNDNIILLDVRSKQEYKIGHIDKFINIPLEELRSRLNELDKSKKIYVVCQIGLRGYYACRILSQNGFDCYNLNGGYRLYRAIYEPESDYKKEVISVDTETQTPQNAITKIDACGLQCPGPILKLTNAIKEAREGETIQITTTDPAFASDIEGYCRRTGNILQSVSEKKGIVTAVIVKNSTSKRSSSVTDKNHKNLIVFSDDLDKAIASFVIANAAAAMGSKVTMFFTFWGLNILRKNKKVPVKKDLISKMFGMMMPRGSGKLSLSKMNMGGIGSRMIRKIMKEKNIDSLEALISQAVDNGVELVACTMSMDVMGLKPEELIDGVKSGGAAAMIACAEESDMSLFI